MKKRITIIIELNNLYYQTTGHAYFSVNENEEKIVDEGMVITEKWADIEFDELILDSVTVLDSEDNEVYEGKALKRHYALFEGIVKNTEIDLEKDYIDIEI